MSTGAHLIIKTHHEMKDGRGVSHIEWNTSPLFSTRHPVAKITGIDESLDRNGMHPCLRIYVESLRDVLDGIKDGGYPDLSEEEEEEATAILKKLIDSAKKAKQEFVELRIY